MLNAAAGWPRLAVGKGGDNPHYLAGPVGFAVRRWYGTERWSHRSRHSNISGLALVAGRQMGHKNLRACTAKRSKYDAQHDAQLPSTVR
jgi:hypothetical protein